MDELQDVVATGKNLTKHRKSYHEKTRLRDEAIVTLFLKTGIRVSECAGIRMCDVDFEKRQFKVRRKGYSDKNQQPIDMSKSVYDALLAYYEVRKKIIPLAGHEEAFFLSLQRKRMSIAGIQRMVKKYALVCLHLTTKLVRTNYEHHMRLLCMTKLTTSIWYLPD